MAKYLTADSIDFGAYLEETEQSTKVRRASEFFDDVRSEFSHTDAGRRYPGMSSTKVGGVLQFPPGEVTVWAGFNGHKKSMFTSQVALDLCQQRRRVLLASFEMTPGKTLGRMARQAAGVPRPSDEWLGHFEAWSDDKLWIFDHMGRCSPHQTIGLCHYFAEQLRGNDIFIDSLMMVASSEDKMDEQKQFVTDLVRTAQDTNSHIHLVAHCRKPPSTGETLPPTRYDIRGTASISDQASNVVLVWANKAKKTALERNPNDEEWIAKPDALVIVDKQRHNPFEGKLQLWFDDRSLRFVDDRVSPIEPYSLQEPIA